MNIIYNLKKCVTRAVCKEVNYFCSLKRINCNTLYLVPVVPTDHNTNYTKILSDNEQRVIRECALALCSINPWFYLTNDYNVHYSFCV